MSYLKRLALGRLQAFRMYGGIGMSASSLHRESTDSLIYMQYLLCTSLLAIHHEVYTYMSLCICIM